MPTKRRKNKQLRVTFMLESDISASALWPQIHSNLDSRLRCNDVLISGNATKTQRTEPGVSFMLESDSKFRDASYTPSLSSGPWPSSNNHHDFQDSESESTIASRQERDVSSAIEHLAQTTPAAMAHYDGRLGGFESTLSRSEAPAGWRSMSKQQKMGYIMRKLEALELMEVEQRDDIYSSQSSAEKLTRTAAGKSPCAFVIPVESERQSHKAQSVTMSHAILTRTGQSPRDFNRTCNSALKLALSSSDWIYLASSNR